MRGKVEKDNFLEECGWDEIERSWIIKDVDIDKFIKSISGDYQKSEITQYYTEYSKHGTQIRLRRSCHSDTRGIRYTCCVKEGSGLKRKEFESIITTELYEGLKKDSIGRYVKKTRYSLITSDNHHEIIFDLFHEPKHMENILKLEIEFPNVETANNFNIENMSFIKEFGGEVIEVTDSDDYTNANIATK